MPRDPQQIQAEIDQARFALAGTLDELAYRASPKKITGDATAATKHWLTTPKGQIAVGVVAAVVVLLVVRKIRNR